MPFIIADACSLILLAKVGLLEKATEIAELAITKEVEEECTCDLRFPDAALIQKYIANKKIRVIEVKEKKSITELGEGEATAIQLYKESNAGAILTDDGKTIRYCKLFMYRYTTTPKVIISLYKKNKISKEEAITAIKKLESEGRYAKDIIASLLLQLGGM